MFKLEFQQTNWSYHFKVTHVNLEFLLLITETFDRRSLTVASYKSNQSLRIKGSQFQHCSISHAYGHCGI